MICPQCDSLRGVGNNSYYMDCIIANIMSQSHEQNIAMLDYLPIVIPGNVGTLTVDKQGVPTLNTHLEDAPMPPTPKALPRYVNGKAVAPAKPCGCKKTNG